MLQNKGNINEIGSKIATLKILSIYIFDYSVTYAHSSCRNNCLPAHTQEYSMLKQLFCSTYVI